MYKNPQSTYNSYRLEKFISVAHNSYQGILLLITVIDMENSVSVVYDVSISVSIKYCFAFDWKQSFALKNCRILEIVELLFDVKKIN